MRKHRTRDGTLIPLSKLTDVHLANIVHNIEQCAKHGLTVILSGGDSPDTFYYDERILRGSDVFDHMGYEFYRTEQRRRILACREARRIRKLKRSGK